MSTGAGSAERAPVCSAFETTGAGADAQVSSSASSRLASSHSSEPLLYVAEGAVQWRRNVVAENRPMPSHSPPLPAARRRRGEMFQAGATQSYDPSHVCRLMHRMGWRVSPLLSCNQGATGRKSV